ncbi:uncharacterized protein LOC131158204 isoform X2 [Malania oleifera]|uniref:uncharacterized protein LOC131158204 isoform X2 n=1 Tax=Malania oleifera TaxID=397392 RepID=UPI0025AE28EF|nr:uncharacterized protein LOC131158204 isoform X2 [Malania oleifera]XP_057968882.1 uncharacterized protein LOC131158204 isoform X2 [Malania oleifera]
MAPNANSACRTATVTLALAAISATTTISYCFLRSKWREMELKLRELELSLRASLEKCAAERQGRIRAQQALRKALIQPNSENLELTSYPMMPIGIIQSCFSNRNGTPRQPLLVPLSRACLVFDAAQVPPASLEGLEGYSHCWIIYVFHLNTDLEKLWKHPANSKFKAKVRVPRLKGGRMGVFATRSPHRPCPIGLTVAKVEAVQGRMVLLSGVDLVDGTPVLDIKPYLPYCDSIQGATVPKWVEVDDFLTVASVRFSEDFSPTLSDCWVTAVLSWDIRSLSQRTLPHNSVKTAGNGEAADGNLNLDSHHEEEFPNRETDHGFHLSGDIIYHLVLEGMDISYRIDSNRNVIVEKVALSSETPNNIQDRRNYMIWKDKL